MFRLFVGLFVLFCCPFLLKGRPDNQLCLGAYRLAPCPFLTLSIEVDASSPFFLCLAFVCCWCLVPEKGSYLHLLPQQTPEEIRPEAEVSCMASAPSRPAPAPLSPPLQMQGPEWCRILLEPGRAVGWGTSSMEGTVYHIGLWHLSSGNQREMEFKKE